MEYQNEHALCRAHHFWSKSGTLCFNGKPYPIIPNQFVPLRFGGLGAFVPSLYSKFQP